MFLSRMTSRISNKWWVAVAVTVGMGMSLMDHTILNVAIPQLQRSFGTDISSVQWVVTIYMITQAAVIPIAPYLTRRFGAKRTYIWTLIAFLLGSVLCGFAWDLPSLVFFRFIQGIGGGILLPMVMILLYQAFPIEERSMVASMTTIPIMVAATLAPLLGGYLLTTFGWQAVFFINIVPGIIGVALAQKVLPETAASTHTRFDLAGFVTIAGGSVAVLYALATLGTGSSAWTMTVALGGAMLLLAFVLIERATQRHTREPLLDLRHFGDRTFTYSMVAIVFQSMVTFGITFLVPLYLQTLRQQTPLQSGMIQGVQALATVLLLPVAGRLAARLGPRPVAVSGVLALAGGVLLMLTLTLSTPIWMIAGILIVMGLAASLVGQLPVVAMSRIEHHAHAGVANGSTLLNVLRATAAPMGVALFSTVVQASSRASQVDLAAQGISGALLIQQSSMLALHTSFLLAVGLACLALGAICLVPGRQLSGRHVLTVLSERLGHRLFQR